MVYAQCCLLHVNARIFFDFLPGAMVEMSRIEALKRTDIECILKVKLICSLTTKSIMFLLHLEYAKRVY